MTHIFFMLCCVTHVIYIVRVTLDDNSFHPIEGLFTNVFVNLLHSYCLRQVRSIQAFASPEIIYYSAITVTLFRAKCVFQMHKIEPFSKQRATIICCKPDRLILCASTYDCNLVCAIEHFVVTFSRNDFFVLAMLKALWQGRCLL